MIFVLFHGAFGSPEGNWFPTLKSQLESLGQRVFAPQFPVDIEADLIEGKKDPTEQKLSKWYTKFESVMRELPKNEKLCFVGHSLGCLFILRAVEKYKIHLDSAIFASAFLDRLPDEIWPYTNIISDFQKTDFDPREMKERIPVSYVIYSDTDPYVPNRQSLMFARAIDGVAIPIRAAGHMNMEVNLDEFGLVLDLCLTRLDISYAQKLKFYKQKAGVFEHVQSKQGAGKATFDSEEAINFKLFRFQNIKNTGYATLYTKLSKLQSANSSYMGFARESAKHMKRFERVIIYDNETELQTPNLRQQITADIAAGIKVFVCKYADIKKEITHPDFGIWDDRYIVINEFNKKTFEPTNTIVSSEKSEITKVKKWWAIVKAHSQPVQ